MKFLNFPKSLLNIFPVPTLITRFAGPLIEVVFVANDPAGEIGSAAPAEAFTTSKGDLSIVEVGLRY